MSQLVSRLLSMQEFRWGVFLNGDDRSDLVRRIVSETRMVLIEEDGEVLAERNTLLLPKYELIPRAFDNARRVSEKLESPVVLYIRNFGEIGSSEVTRLPRLPRLVTQVVYELDKLKRDSSRVFVIVSSSDELELSLRRSGRLLKLESFAT